MLCDIVTVSWCSDWVYHGLPPQVSPCTVPFCSFQQYIPTVSSVSPFPHFQHALETVSLCFPIVLTTAFRDLALLGAWPLLRRLRGLRGLTHGAGGDGAQDQEDGLGTEAEGRQLTWRSMRSMGKHGKTWTGEGWHKIYIRYNIWYMIIWYIGWHIYRMTVSNE